MTQLTPEQIHERARAGDQDAQFALARVFDQQGRHDVAIGWLQRAADAGHVASATWLGVRLLAGKAAPSAPDAGAALILKAAKAGGGEAAARAAVLCADAVGHRQDWAAALDWLRKAADNGDGRAPGQLKALEAEAAFHGKPLDLAKLTRPGKGESVIEGPRILVFERFASPEVCDWILGRSEGRLAPARVNDSEQGGKRENRMRTNTVTGFGIAETDLVVTLVRARIAEAAKARANTLEAVNVLHYDPGQQFEPHYDFIAPEVPHFARELATLGQRVATALLYLNEGYEGGETDFPELGYRYKGGKGDLMLFYNVLPSGEPDRRMVHAGTAPTSGEKWILSQWIRDRAQPIV